MIMRIKYTRGKEIRYLAHLDMMKVFERAVRRSGIRVSYSNGFNRRPAIIYGMPISLGMISLAEYADIKLEEDISGEIFMKTVNERMPGGIKIIEAGAADGKKNIMSAVSHARYVIRTGCCDGLEDAVAELMKEDEVIIDIVKDGKDKKKEIRKGVFSACADKEKLCLFMRSGQTGNIKPEEFIKALVKFTDKEIVVQDIIREEIYVPGKDGRPVLPLDRRAV